MDAAVSVSVCVSSRPLTQDELDGFHRAQFVNYVLRQVQEHPCAEIKFLAIRNHYNLVTIKQCNTGGGEWEFSVGDHHWYTYRLSDVVAMLEKLYDEKARIVALKGEIEIHNPEHPVAKTEDE